MYLFFDTETTGLPKNYKAPATDTDNWPRLLQIGMIVFDRYERELLREKYYILPPEGGFDIHPQALETHKISNDICRAEGIPLEDALRYFSGNLWRSNHLVAHNFDYDKMIIGAEFVRTGLRFDHKYRTHCTKEASTAFCKLPNPKNPRGGYKWPKLAELHEKLFGTGFDEAHDALADVSATAKCFFELKRRGVITL